MSPTAYLATKWYTCRVATYRCWNSYTLRFEIRDIENAFADLMSKKIPGIDDTSKKMLMELPRIAMEGLSCSHYTYFRERPHKRGVIKAYKLII